MKLTKLSRFRVVNDEFGLDDKESSRSLVNRLAPFTDSLLRTLTFLNSFFALIFSPLVVLFQFVSK